MASKSRMLENIDRSTWTFGQLLNWHLENGTRPDGTPGEKGVPWQNKTFAAEVGKHSAEGPKGDRTLRNWRNGETVPSPADFAGILQALFGGKPSYVDWRQELTEKYHAARGEGRELPTAPASPSSLPTKPLRCLGRDEELKSVIDALTAERDGIAVLVLGGAGMGKTTVTREAAVALTLIERFGQRRWFVELETAPNAEALEQAIIVAIGLDPASARFDAALAKLGQAPGLLVLDNLETPWDGERDKVEALLASLHRAPQLALLASIRGNEPPAGVRWGRQRTMHPLEAPHDGELFLDIATDIKPSDSDLSPLLGQLGGVPIAIELVAQQAAPHDTLAAVHAEWQRVGTVLAKRRGVEPSRLSSLEISLELSFQSPRLTDAGRRLFCILGQLPAGMAPEDVETLLGHASFEARQELLSTALAIERGDRLDLLPPIRDHATRHHTPSLEDRERWRKHYLALIRVLGDKIGSADGAASIPRLMPELANLDAAQRIALMDGDIGTAVDTVYGIARLMSYTGLGTLSTIDALSTGCHVAKNTTGEAHCTLNLGLVARARSNYDGARKAFEQALPLFREVNDIIGQANCVKGLGDIALARSDHEAARRAYEQAQPLYRQGGIIIGEANCIRNLGDIALERFDHEGARKAYEQALLLYRQAGDALGEANCILRLGDIAFARFDQETARKAYEQALPLYRRIGQVLGEANSIKCLGDVALRRADYESARTSYEQAQPLYRKIGQILGEANCIHHLGDIARACADNDAARVSYEHALVLYEQVQDPYSVGLAHHTLASVTQSTTRLAHRAAAKQAWLSIGREDLVKGNDLSDA